MASENSSDNTNSSSIDEVPIPRIVRFWLLLFLDMSAVCCTAFLLYHLLFKRQLRQALHNHIVIIILMNILLSQLFDISFYIIFLRLGYVWWQTPAFCFFWWFMDTGLYSMLTILLTYGSFERHILVYHSNLVATRRKQLFFHYIPLSFVLIYCFVFYSYAIFFTPCENNFDYTQAWCSYPCYYNDPVLSVYDTIGNGIVLTLLTVISDIGLIVRHIYHRRQMQQVIQWRKYRKMLIQLLSISGLELFFTLPVLIIIGAEQCGVSEDILGEAALYTVFFSYFIMLLLPYACLIPFPELRKIIYRRPRNWFVTRLHPTNIIVPLDVTHRSNR